MGLFDIFKKKTEEGDSGAPDTRRRAGEASRLRNGDTSRPRAGDASSGESSRIRRSGESSRLMSDDERTRQRELARATAAKIDEIELAMAKDIFNTPEPAWGSGPRRPRINAPSQTELGDRDTLPMLELATTVVLSDDDVLDAPAAAETAPVIEEIAMLYGNGQIEIAEHMLKDSLGDLGKLERGVWWLLFDLYQVADRREDFDSLAIDYTSHFETSPPTWVQAWSQPVAPTGSTRSFAGVTPTEILSGKLDAGCATQTERLLRMADQHPVLRLEMRRINETTPEGCAILLAALTRLRKKGHEMIIAGAAELAELLRGSIEIGKGDAPQAPWLLLLELLQLLNQEKDFEETAMDYCVTYEVSPPSFVASDKVATAASAHAAGASDRFMLPPLAVGNIGPLLDAIEAYAHEAEVVVLDCSRLSRIDYAAATSLLGRLRTLGENRRIELRDLNHLVAALLKLLGFNEVARLFPLKY